MSEQDGKFVSIAEGAFIALGSAYIYLITFVYEFGYCFYFHIPFTLISPSTSTVLMVGATTILFLASSFHLFSWAVQVFHVSKNSKKSIEKWISSNFLCLVVGLAFFMLLQIWWLALWLTVFLVAMNNSIFLFLVISDWKRKKVLTDVSVPRKYDLSSLLNSRFGKERVEFCRVLFVFIPAIATLMGFAQAARQEEFLFLKQKSDYAILRIYGDTAIAAQINRNSKLVGKDLLLLKMPTEKTQLELHEEKIGPLKEWGP